MEALSAQIITKIIGILFSVLSFGLIGWIGYKLTVKKQKQRFEEHPLTINSVAEMEDNAGTKTLVKVIKVGRFWIELEPLVQYAGRRVIITVSILNFDKLTWKLIYFDHDNEEEKRRLIKATAEANENLDERINSIIRQQLSMQ